MSCSLCGGLLSLLLLLQAVRARPGSDLQSLKQLLEEEGASEEEPEQQKVQQSVASAPQEVAWRSSDLSSLQAARDLLWRALGRSSRRSWSRYKKGGMRSCFGVRLERIGSFSGLGC